MNKQKISEIELQLEKLREEIIGKIKSLLETCENKTLSWEREDVRNADNAFVYYSDENGFPYEGIVNKAYIDANNNLVVGIENDDYPVELSETDYDYALRSHQWLIDIFKVMCEVLEITPDTV